MTNHQTLKFLIKAWRITKMVLGILSLAGAFWAVRIIVTKNRPVQYGGTFPLPNVEGGAAVASTPDALIHAEPQGRPQSNHERSPEASAVLAQINPARPAPVPSPESASPPQAKPTPSPEPAPAAGQNSKADLPISIQPLEATAPQVKQARELFDQYRRTEGWWDRMSMVRSASRVASLAHHFYEDHHRTDPITDRLIGATQFTLDGKSFIQLAFLSPSRWSNTTRVNFLFSDDGEPTIDWESFVGYGDQSWTDFITSRTDRPTLMRCYVAIDDYYNFEFSDRDRFISTKLTSPDGKSTVFGYCETKSSEGEALTRITNQLATMLLDGPLPVSGLGPTVPVVLEISFPKKAQSDKCVTIHKIISNRWILTDDEQRELTKDAKTKAPLTKDAVVKK